MTIRGERNQAGPILDYVAATAAVVVALLFRLSLNSFIGNRAPWVFFFPPIALVAWRYGLGPSILAVVLSTLAGFTFFVRREIAIGGAEPKDLYILFAFVLSAAVIVAFGASNQRTRQNLVGESSERERTSRELVESLESFRGVFDHAQGDAVILLDPDLKIVAWNPGAEAIFGHPADEAVGRTLGFILPPEEHDGEARSQAATQGFAAENRWYRRRDGGRFWGNGSLVALHREDGAIRGYVKVLRDETTRYELEEATRRHAEDLERHVAESTADLRAANAELEGFTYSVSHDMRSPLRAIVANAQLIEEDYAELLPQDARNRLERITVNARRMGALIEDLLTYARLNKQALAKSTLDLAALFREVVEQERGDLPIEAYAPAELRVWAEPGLMRMVLENLVGNAIKYRRQDAPLRLKFNLVDHDGACGYALRDNGIGFDPQYTPKLFQPFERLHRIDQYEGTGIGLANVKRIVERHGGTVWAEGEPNVGSTFGFTLP